MSDMMTQPLSPAETEQETVLNLFFQEFDSLQERMRNDQADIDRLKAETRIISAHTDQLLLQIEAQLDALQRAS